jgi:hypothetical protein
MIYVTATITLVVCIVLLTIAILATRQQLRRNDMDARRWGRNEGGEK